tara:strand:+ start:416 stop:808 length:393 start_codon:yes stop_codon:yes gene_type:complete
MKKLSKRKLEQYHKFRDLAEKRVQSALKTLELIKNLSNTNNYYYGRKDWIAIDQALRRAVRDIRVSFEKEGKDDVKSFTLSKNVQLITKLERESYEIRRSVAAEKERGLKLDKEVVRLKDKIIDEAQKGE